LIHAIRAEISAAVAGRRRRGQRFATRVAASMQKREKQDRVISLPREGEEEEEEEKRNATPLEEFLKD